ncbi:NPCBM/NEW2 domain-containing protein [Lachnospiraceae bacterium 46-15]
MGRKKITAVFLAICMVFSVLFPQIAAEAADEGEPTVINAADYGASPEAEDNAEAVKAAIEAAKQIEGPVVISFPKGEYQIYPDKAYERELYISNTVGANQSHKMKKIGFLLEGMENVTIEGNGSMFMFHGAMTSFATIDCKNITFQNCEYDFKVPSVIDITAESVEGNSAVIYVPECYNYTVSGTTVTWRSDVSPYTGQPYWTATNALANAANQVYDAATGLTVRSGTPLFNNLSSIEDLGNHRLKFNYSSINSSIKPGLSYQMRNTTRDHSGMFFWKSEDITLKDIDAHFLYGFGIVGQHSTNITLDGVNIETPEGSGRTTAGFADFVQMSGCKGEIRVENCLFSNPHDDPINIHGTFNQVTERISDTKFKVSYMHHETAGFPNFFVGDEVEFMTSGNMIPVEGSVAKVIDVQGPTGNSGASASGSGSLTDIIITLDKAMPAEIAANSHVVENITYTPSVVIRNNTFKQVPTRGILVTTRKKVEIKDNVFDGMGMASIYISNDAQGWYESGPVRDVTIEGNTFLRPTGGAAVIFIEPTNPSVSREKTIHENIKILDNTFYMQNGQVLNAKSVKDLSFTGNRIYRYEPEISLSLEASSGTLREGKSIQLVAEGEGKVFSSNLYAFNGCKNVTLSNNVYDGGLKLNATTQNMDEGEVHVAEGEDVVVDGDANVLPAVRGIVYESSDEAVLKIAEDGTATGLKPGTTVVKAYVQNGTERYESNEVTVTVTEAPKTEKNAFLLKAEAAEGLKLDRQFDSHCESYTGEADRETVSMKLEAEEKNAEIEVIADGKSAALGKGVLEAQIPMHGGNNKVYIRVTSPNGEVDKIYEFDITGIRTGYLSDMDYVASESSGGWAAKGTLVNDKSIENNPLTLMGEGGKTRVFEKGLGSHADCTLVYNIEGLGYTEFSAYVGIDQEITNRNEASAAFRIYGDGVLLAETETMRADTAMKFLSVSVEGVRVLKLTADKVDNNSNDHVDFADAKLSASLPMSETVHTVRFQASVKSGAAVSADTGKAQTSNGFIGVADGGTVTLTAAVKGGYEFLGWYDAEGNLCTAEAVLTVSEIQTGKVYTAKVKAVKTQLQTAVAAAEKKELGSYSPESAEAYRKALAAAQAVMKNENATAKEVQEALEALQTAEGQLVIKTTPGVNTGGDSRALRAAVEAAKKTDLNVYTEESAEKYRAALASAEKVLAKAGASQAEIDTAIRNLQAAQAALVKKIPDKGTILPAQGGRYQVVDPKRKTARLVEVINKKAPKLNVPATVKLNGMVFTVTEIGDKVMKGNTKLKKVVLGKNVTSIGKQAFMGCKNLKSVQLKGKAPKTIKTGAFKKTSAKLVVSAKKLNKKQKAALQKKLKKAGMGKKGIVK